MPSVVVDTAYPASMRTADGSGEFKARATLTVDVGASAGASVGASVGASGAASVDVFGSTMPP